MWLGLPLWPGRPSWDIEQDPLRLAAGLLDLIRADWEGEGLVQPTPSACEPVSELLAGVCEGDSSSFLPWVLPTGRLATLLALSCLSPTPPATGQGACLEWFLALLGLVKVVGWGSTAARALRCCWSQRLLCSSCRTVSLSKLDSSISRTSKEMFPFSCVGSG